MILDFNKKSLFALIVLCINFADAGYVEPEQIISKRYEDHGVHYALPGWEANLTSGDLPQNLPPTGKFLHVSLKNPEDPEVKISYGGKKYDEVTITSEGRIYLGHLPDDYEILDGINGVVPYIEPTIKKLLPNEGCDAIPVKWKVLQPDLQYAVVEIGPFTVENFANPLSFQVFLYTDGEIQFYSWVDWDAVWETKGKSYTSFFGRSYSSTLQNLQNKETLVPAVYNGMHKTVSDYASMVKTKNEYILKGGELRPGWIAKSFDSAGVVFTPVEGAVNIDFGINKSAGGLFAYDYSREHPVVGGLDFVSFEVKSLSYGSGLSPQEAVPVYFWYFGLDNGDIIPKSRDANYPYFVDDPKLSLENNVWPLISEPQRSLFDGSYPIRENKFIPVDKILTVANGASVIWPAAYMTSWNLVQNPDWVKAIAFKFQTNDLARNRAIQIKNIQYGLRQPRSVQFLPPATHKLTFESNGLGYMEGINFKSSLPYEFLDGASLSAIIHPAPGDTIERVYLNDILLYALDGTANLNEYVLLRDDGTAEFNFPDAFLDLHIKVEFKKCESRMLPAVEPSYVKTEIYVDPADSSKKLEYYAVKDGLGRVVQTQTYLGNGYYKVEATYLDDFGNVEYAPIPYLSSRRNFAYEDMSCKQCIIKSSAYHDGSDDLDRQYAYGFPYAKENFHYGEDDGVTKDAAGVAEASFGMWNTSQKQWTIPLDVADTSKFLSEELLKEEYLAEKYVATKKLIVDVNKDIDEWAEYNYKLVVNRSMEGIFTQQIFDAYGNILFTWAKSGDSTIISRTHYNANSQVDTTDVSVNGGPFILATTYAYDEMGRINTVTTPDKGTTERVYDSEDRIRFTRDARQRALAEKNTCNGNYFSTIEYGAFDRVTRTGEVRCGHSFDAYDTPVPDDKLYIFSENFYGKPTIEELLSTGVTNDSSLLQGILDEMEGVLPTDVGAVAAYDGTRLRSDTALSANSLKLSSYNRLGQKLQQWTIYGFKGVPATRASFSYNTSGELTSTETSAWKSGAWEPISSLTYNYDEIGRLRSVFENGDSLVRIDRTPSGIVSKKTYFDKGERVYGMTYGRDIYGRPMFISYKDAAGKNLYSDSVVYSSVVASRLSSAEHSWDGYYSRETYSYDELGRLVGYVSDNPRVGSGSYAYDGLGRLISKTEGDTTIRYTYGNTGFKPLAMGVNEGIDTAYYIYDASGNLWLDRNSRNTYTINALGLPDRVRLFAGDPANVIYNSIYGDSSLVGEIGRTDMAYDETGTRIWTKFLVGAPFYRAKASYPGVGEYSYSGNLPPDSLELTRVDLVDGAYRIGKDGGAIFPVKDVQGSIRGYADRSGLKSAFGYRPYGMVVDFSRNSADGSERWQSKEFDDEQGKYYFGARFFDPFFGMWISPDPAGQYMNPYGYGGDPLNYVDPTGLWAFGIGVVVGWNKEHGWSFGFGAALEIGDEGFNASYTVNQDGSKSLNLGSSVTLPVFTTGFWLDLGMNFRMNSYTGTSLSRSGGVCFGASKELACSGIEVGDGFNWNRSGGFMGMSVHMEVYSTYLGGLMRVSNGYEAGLFGAEGRGLYAGGSIVGVHGEATMSGDVSWGFEEQLHYKLQDLGKGPDGKKRQYVGLSIPTLGVFSDVIKYDHGNRNDNQKDIEDLNRQGFKDLAESNGMKTGHYNEWTSGLHENNKLAYYLRLVFSKLTFSLIDPPKRTVDKMWMGADSRFSFLYGWFLIPSVEGLFYPGGEYVRGASYNYGNFFLSHIFWDVIPSFVFDRKEK